MHTTLLSTPDLRSLLLAVGPDVLMDALIQRLESGLTTYDPAAWQTPARSGFHYQEPAEGLLEWMPTRAPDGRISVKLVGYHPRNPTGAGLPTILSTVALFDGKTGHLCGLADATFLTALRTGAASAVATRRLAAPDASILGLVGVGAQAITQLHALSRVLPLREVHYFDSDPAAMQSFPRRIERFDLGSLRLVPGDAASVFANSEVLCTATSNAVGAPPVIPDAEHRPGLHINAVGSDFPGKVELPATLLRRAVVVPDFALQAVREGECQQLEAAEIGPSLPELIQGGARDQEKLTVFDSTGWSFEDHLGVELLLEFAAEHGLGTRVELEPTLSDPLDPYSLELGTQTLRFIAPGESSA